MRHRTKKLRTSDSDAKQNSRNRAQQRHSIEIIAESSEEEQQNRIEQEGEEAGEEHEEEEEEQEKVLPDQKIEIEKGPSNPQNSDSEEAMQQQNSCSQLGSDGSQQDEEDEVNETAQMQWYDCPFDLLQVTDEIETLQSLAPTVRLCVPGENQEAELQFDIQMKRNFQYTEAHGWQWHKSWNLPEIICTLRVRDPATHSDVLCPQKLHAQLYIVKTSETASTELSTFHLIDVGVRGSRTRAEFDDGVCRFSGLQFTSTSYNENGKRFHLVVVVCLAQNKFQFPRVVRALISQPILVDSRRSARDSNRHKRQGRLFSYVEPFEVALLDRTFCKKNVRSARADDDTPGKTIVDSIDGLNDYLTAANIRSKAKHPLFLAMRFKNCLTLYITRRAALLRPRNDEGEEALEGICRLQILKLQEILSQRASQVTQKPLRKGAKIRLQELLDRGELDLLLQLHGTENRLKLKKTAVLLEILLSDKILISFEQVRPPPDLYDKVRSDSKQLRKCYEQLFAQLHENFVAQQQGLLKQLELTSNSKQREQEEDEEQKMEDNEMKDENVRQKRSSNRADNEAQNSGPTVRQQSKRSLQVTSLSLLVGEEDQLVQQSNVSTTSWEHHTVLVIDYAALRKQEKKKTE